MINTNVQGFDEPVIILGFHHSGTRIIAEFMSDLGIFQVGKTITYEWKYLQKMNDKILSDWTDSSCFNSNVLKAKTAIIGLKSTLLRLKLNGYKGGLWGFKDPRVCATLPTWLAKFPKAKVVFVVRNPLDVIGTFPIRYQRFDPENKVPSTNIKFWAELYLKTHNFMMEVLKEFGKDFITIRYEDFCNNPKLELTTLASKLEIAKFSLDEQSLDKIKSSENKYLKLLAQGEINQEDINIMTELFTPILKSFHYN